MKTLGIGLAGARYIDVVDICVPPALHHSFAIREADAGKHIIKENPLTGYFGADGDPVPIGTRVPRARMREGARNNAEAVRRNGVKFCYAENWIYAPPIEKMRRLIAASKGSILELHAEENHSGSVYAPIERFGTPEELASFFVFLCSKRASYSVGSTYFVDEGMPRTTS